MVILLTGRSCHALGPPPAWPRPANVDAGGLPRRRGLSCANERLAQHGTPAALTGSSRARSVHARVPARAAGGAVRPGANPRSVLRQARQNLTADLPEPGLTRHRAWATLAATHPAEPYVLHAA
jgi:hypothetical protein